MIKASDVNFINNKLEDIFSHKTCKIKLTDLNDDDQISETYATVFANLVSRIIPLDHRVETIPDSTILTSDIYGAISGLNPHFGITSTILKYRIIDFLCAHLQAERIAVLGSTAEPRKKKAGERSTIIFQLAKILRDLEVPLDGAHKVDDLISIASSHLVERLKSVPEIFLVNPPKILINQTLTVEQTEIVDKAVNQFYEDFQLRRRMLLQRLDVTIKSFLWGEKAQGKKEEIDAAIKAQLESLSVEPIKYMLKDALEAPVSLLYESSKRVTDNGSRKSNLAIYSIIGSVPDRGGRANEMRPKAASSGGRGGGGNTGRGGGKGNKGGNKRPRPDHNKNKENSNEQGQNTEESVDQNQKSV